MATEIHLVRHAKVMVSSGVCYGRSDVVLCEPVHQHAHWLRARLPRDAAVFSSPSLRCALLAKEIGADRLVMDERLAEMDFGDWEMQAFDDLPRTMIDAWAADPLGFRVPGGETGDEVLARAEAALDEILVCDAPVVIVAHGGPLRAIRGKLLGLPREDWLGQDLSLASLTSLHRQGGQWIADALLRFEEHAGEK